MDYLSYDELQGYAEEAFLQAHDKWALAHANLGAEGYWTRKHKADADRHLAKVLRYEESARHEWANFQRCISG
jgi:hypothetical protein